jgi:Microcystin-dependent protein
MDVGNFTGQPNKDFPWDNNMLDFLQNNQTLLAILGRAVGDKIIMAGCTVNGTRIDPGYIFMRTNRFPLGEIIPFEGGVIDSVNTTVYVDETAISVSAEGYTYSQAYYSRTLKAGLGDEQYLWSGFDYLETNATLKSRCKSLEDAVALLAPESLGFPKTWAGYLNKLPDGFVLCDGRALNIADYPALYDKLGTLHNTVGGVTTPEGQFRIPDLRHRFIVGYDASDDDYNAIGKIGGEKTHVLTIDEMPAHTHTQSGKDSHNSGTSGSGADSGTTNTGSTGGSQAHENRPPYYTLAYVMRLN